MKDLASSSPFLTSSDFIQISERMMVHIPLALKPVLEQRFAWLKQIANEQEGKEQNQ